MVCGAPDVLAHQGFRIDSNRPRAAIKLNFLGQASSVMYTQIFRNLLGNSEWIGSFYERLADHGDWCIDEFWQLHKELVDIARSGSDSPSIERKLASAVVTLQAKISNLISAHYDANDVFTIRNLSSDELLAFRERLDHAVTGFFSGEVIAESAYELTNPLIAT